jgi:hypothetical protein
VKTRAKKRTLLTRHSRKKRNAIVQKKILELRTAWDFLGPVARGEWLRELTALGCTQRGIAKDIRVSATNVRFHLDLAKLTQTEKQAITEGASAKRAVLILQERQEEQKRIDRVRAERATAAISDQLGKDIVEFCSSVQVWIRPEDLKKEEIVLVEGDVEGLFVEVRGAIEMRVRGYLRMPPAAATRLDFRTVSRIVKPNQKEYDFWMSWLAHWLAVTILSVAPEAFIRDAALKKAPALLFDILRARPRGPVRHFRPWP